MKQKSIKKNFIYNLIFTSINLIFPLITAPYLSSVLGATNIGKVNYATSLINWFIIFSSFGIPRYGVREIARNRDDRKKLSMAFWNLIIIQCIVTIIITLLYIIMILNLNKFRSEINLYLLMTIILFLNLFTIDWFYQGIEEYGYITVRNMIFKIISICLIFLMIKNKSDYILYAIINIFALTFNNILNCIHARKYIYKKIYSIKILYYIKELRVYFFTTLVISIYTSLDQVMVGNYSERDLAYYVRSKTIQSVGMNITNSLVTVFVPRTAYLIKENYKKYSEIIEKSINYIYILSIPCILGLIFLAKEITLLLGGNEFLPAVNSLKVISILILINSITVWQINQILIPHKLENLAFKLQAVSAILSIVINSILIPKYSYIGASVTWVLVEIFLLFMTAYFIRRKCRISVKYINKSLMKYLFSGFIMSLIIVIIKMYVKNYILIIFICIPISCFIYFGIILILKDEVTCDIYRVIKNKINFKFK